MCGTSSQSLESDGPDGHLCAAHMSVLMPAERVSAKSFLPGIFHTALYTSVCLHFTVGNKSYLNKSGTGKNQSGCFLISQTLMFGVLPPLASFSSSAKVRWDYRDPLVALACQQEHGPVCAAWQSVLQQLCEESWQTSLWDFPILTNPSAHTAPTASPLQMGFYDLLVKPGVFLALCVCTPRNNSDSSLLCCTRNWNRSIAFCRSAFFFN